MKLMQVWRADMVNNENVGAVTDSPAEFHHKINNAGIYQLYMVKPLNASKMAF